MTDDRGFFGDGDPVWRHVLYRDDGCDLAPSCLECPLPECKYESRVRLAERRSMARSMRETINVKEIAVRTGVSPRTVYRDLGVSS